MCGTSHRSHPLGVQQPLTNFPDFMSLSGQVSDPEVLLYNFPPGLAPAEWLTQTLTAKHLTAETTQDHTSQLCGFGPVI